MIEIVGKDQSALKRTTCNKCTSILQYALADVQMDYSSDYNGGRDYYKYVKCPCCGNQVIVKRC